MKALILAGGKGARLRPYTTVLPKPLMPVGEMPILAVILRQLKAAGITEVVLAVNYLHHIIQAVLGDGSQHGVNLVYSLEEQELGTAGPISLAFDLLGDDFLIMNGDILTTLDYRDLVAHHLQRGPAATVCVHTREVHIDFGVLDVRDDGMLAGYREKPNLTCRVSMGINVLKKKAVAGFLERNVRLDLPDLFLALMARGEAVSCYSKPCFWLDIGRLDDYQAANEVFDSMRGQFLP